MTTSSKLQPHEAALSGSLQSPTRGQEVGKADAGREAMGTCTVRDCRETGPGIQGNVCRDNGGKGHFPAGTGNNLQGPRI